MKFTKRHEDTIKVEIDQKSSTISVWNNGISELVTKRREGVALNGICGTKKTKDMGNV